MNNDSFIPSLLNEKIKVPPKFLHKNVSNVINSILVEKNEGKCTKHGYIKRDSIKIIKTSVGRVEAHTLHGFVNYDVQFSAMVCNPTNGSVLKCRVVNSNNFGVLCSSGIQENDTYVPILDIIVPKNSLTIRSDSEISLNELQKGDTAYVEIVGKKFEINDTKISAVGRIVDIAKKDSVSIDVENNEDDDNVFDEEDIYEDDFDEAGESVHANEAKNKHDSDDDEEDEDDDVEGNDEEDVDDEEDDDDEDDEDDVDDDDVEEDDDDAGSIKSKK